MAAGRTTGHHLIVDIQSTDAVASSMAAFRSVAALRYQSVLGMLEVRYLGPRIGAVDPLQPFGRSGLAATLQRQRPVTEATLAECAISVKNVEREPLC